MYNRGHRTPIRRRPEASLSMSTSSTAYPSTSKYKIFLTWAQIISHRAQNLHQHDVEHGLDFEPRVEDDVSLEMGYFFEYSMRAQRGKKGKNMIAPSYDHEEDRPLVHIAKDNIHWG
ncbi:hypothetical protein O6P43_013980 [Quillaja saponaria]|uniref:Uncharacterized protein n=1 Tax=Quillaja saponaria TaxID=32244 RepID=A0AAD7LTN9_QUISA|nr:hypothetical protein O6P43_013980 [Quillaja saponaria]